MPRKFKIGDIVRCTQAGRAEQAAGSLEDTVEVMSLCEGDDMNGEFLISVGRVGTGTRWGRWRERWYELVEPEGPW